jgi:glycosyltransferase involved in cell wall biosynthesis
MLADRDLIVLSDDWHGLPTSSIHLFRRLSQGNRVFWFNTIGRLPRPSFTDARKVLRTMGNWAVKNRPSRSARTDDASVHLVSPLMIPWFKRPIRRFNLFCFLRQYEGLAKKFGISRPIVVTTFPFAVDFVAAVPDALKLYYCVDDFLNYPGVDHAGWAIMEAQLLQIIDGLVITCQTLAKKRINHCPLLHLPHGVDFEHFHLAVHQAVPVPRMASLPRPVIGFFGLVGKWVDLSVISYLSRAFPRCSFVLLGRSEVDLQPLAACPNVHSLGWVPYSELPRYARYFDVGLIPFVLNDLTRAVNPLKLMEYFALGIPVLSTRLPELEMIQGPLHLAIQPEEFAAGLSDILRRRTKASFDEAIALARANTWDARAEEFSGYVERLEESLGKASHPARAPYPTSCPGKPGGVRATRTINLVSYLRTSTQDAEKL